MLFFAGVRHFVAVTDRVRLVWSQLAPSRLTGPWEKPCSRRLLTSKFLVEDSRGSTGYESSAIITP